MLIMNITKSEHLKYLKQKVAQLNQEYSYQLKEGSSSLQYLRDICFVIATLIREIRFLEKDEHTGFISRFSRN
jgi:hypothetical protein